MDCRKEAPQLHPVTAQIGILKATRYVAFAKWLGSNLYTFRSKGNIS